MIKTIVLFLRKNFKPLLVSFLLALMLWAVVTTNRVYKMQINVPLHISNVAEGYVLVNPPPETLIVEVSGKGTSLIILNFFDVVLDLNLPDLNTNKEIELMDYSNRISIPHDLSIQVLEILEPKTVMLKVDKLAQLKIPVELKASVKSVPGYIYLGAELSQDSVLVSGPESIIASFLQMSTSSFTRDNVQYPFSETLEIQNPKPGIIDITPKTIRVNFLVEQLVERNLYNVPIQIVGLPDNLTASAIPPYVSIRIKGGESLVSKLGRDQITVLFNYARQFREDVERYPMEIRTPENIQVLETSPQKFRLQLKKKD